MLAREFQRLDGRHHADLLVVAAIDHAHLGDADTFVDTGLILVTTATIERRAGAVITTVEGGAYRRFELRLGTVGAPTGCPEIFSRDCTKCHTGSQMMLRACAFVTSATWRVLARSDWRKIIWKGKITDKADLYSKRGIGPDLR